MPKFIKNISRKAGHAPGTLVHIGEKKIGKESLGVRRNRLLPKPLS